MTEILLMLSPPSTTIVPHAISLDQEETLSNLACLPDPSCLTLKTTCSPTLRDIEALIKLKQTRNLADDNLFGGLRVKTT